tara:strand:- start:136 stop:291 length:156 start_codon:yes stop_codon:yes gene_type:complete
MENIINELGTILLYIAAFGFSDFFIQIYQFPPEIYYLVILILGLFLYKNSA